MAKSHAIFHRFGSRPKAAPDSTTQLLERTREHGLLIGKGGLYGNVIRLSPMLNIGKTDVDEAVRLLDHSLSEVQA